MFGARLYEAIGSAYPATRRTEPRIAEQRAVESLRADLSSGRWTDLNRELISLDAAELGLRLLVA